MTEDCRSVHDHIMQTHQYTGDSRDCLPVSFASKTRTRRRWLRPFLYSLLGVIIVGGGAVSMWRLPVYAEGIAQSAAKKTSRGQQPVQAKSDVSTDPFSTATSKAGVMACAATYVGLGKALTEGTQFMVQTHTAKANVDRHGVQGVIGMTFQSSTDGNYAGPAAGLVFATPTVQGCEGNAVRVVPFVQNCEAATAFLPQDSQVMQPLSGLAVYSLPTGGHAMLVPAGTGCVAISILRGSA